MGSRVIKSRPCLGRIWFNIKLTGLKQMRLCFIFQHLKWIGCYCGYLLTFVRIGDALSFFLDQNHFCLKKSNAPYGIYIEFNYHRLKLSLSNLLLLCIWWHINWVPVTARRTFSKILTPHRLRSKSLLYRDVDSLVSERCGRNIKGIVYTLIIQNCSLGYRFEIASSWMPHNPIDEKSTLVQVIDRCRQAINNLYLSPWGPRSLSSYGSLGHNELNHVFVIHGNYFDLFWFKMDRH